MNPVQIIINIQHDDEPKAYTVRLASTGKQLAGFDTIKDTDTWLKSSGGSFTSDPQESRQGWYREAQIAAWAYHQITAAQSRTEKKAA